MGDRYSGVGAAPVGTDRTLLALISAPTVRPRLYELLVSSVATPADVATRFHVERLTAVGTEGSGFSPVPLDPNSPAAAADYGVGVYSVEPSYTPGGVLLNFSLNQRATFRWVAAPGGELLAPATASNGLGLQSQSSGGTAIHEVTMHHEE